MNEYSKHPPRIRTFAKELQGRESALLAFVQKARSFRAQFFPAHLFSDPAWDILLDLYQAELSQFRLSISKVCEGSGLPATTILRWLNVLESRAIVRRHRDPGDARRVFVELTPDARSGMDQLFEAMLSRLPVIQPDC